MRVELNHPDGLTAGERGRFAVLRWRMVWNEWCGPLDIDHLPGRRVRARWGYVEVERVFSTTPSSQMFGTGARMRKRGWTGPRVSKLRFAIPWRNGTLLVRALA